MLLKHLNCFFARHSLISEDGVDERGETNHIPQPMARTTARMPRPIHSFREPASKCKTANDIFISIDIASAMHTICLWHKPHFTLCLTGFRVMENERVDYLFCDYISMAKNTPYILVNHEAMSRLHFCTPSFFQASSYTFAVNPHYTPVNSCHTSSTPALIMTLSLCYAASHSRPPTAVPSNCVLPVVYANLQ